MNIPLLREIKYVIQKKKSYLKFIRTLNLIVLASG